MSRCEDFPCCGHEAGCCPSFDADTGEQLDMKCTCGASVPLSSRYSICQGCLDAPEPGDAGHDYERDYDYESRDFGYDYESDY